MAGIGNAWVDLFRATTWILLPLSLVFALFLASQGVIQNFAAYQEVTTLEVTKYDNPKLDADGQPLKDDKGNAVTEPATTRPRPCRWVRLPRRRRSRCSAPTVAASSTPTRRIPLRIRRRW
jgi:hypothetical protein